MTTDVPGRPLLLQQVQVNEITTSAWAQQGGSPQIRLLASDVQGGLTRLLRELLNAFIADA
jgi:hypothetical protein